MVEAPPPQVRGLRRAQGKYSKLQIYRDAGGSLAYARNELKLDPYDDDGRILTPDQEKVLLALETPRAIVSAEAGNGVGKTRVAAIAVSWFFDCFPKSLIITTAPTWGQVKDLLWAEIRTDRERLARIGETIVEDWDDLLSLPIGAAADEQVNQVEIRTADPKHYAKGLSTTVAEAFQGFHAPYILIITDEGPGVRSEIFKAIHRVRSGGDVRWLNLGNPISKSDDSHQLASEPGATLITISGLNHPNVITGRNLIPGAVTREWVDERVPQWCERVADPKEADFEWPVGSGDLWKAGPLAQTSILGIPPDIEDDAVVSYAVYHGATRRNPDACTDSRLRWGLDVARGVNDFNSLWLNEKGVARRLAAWQSLDTTVSEERVKALLEPYGGKSIPGRVDATGIGGPVADHLRADGYDVTDVHNGAPAKTEERYKNLGTEAYFDAAEWLKENRIEEDGGGQVGDDLTRRKYEYARGKGGAGVYQLESKDEFKKRVKRSPDDGDGFVLCVMGDHLLAGSYSWDSY